MMALGWALAREEQGALRKHLAGRKQLLTGDAVS